MENMATIFSTVPGITTPIMLVAFFAAIGAWAYGQKLSTQRKHIQSLPPSQREDAVLAFLTSRRVDVDMLTQQQRFQYVMEDLRKRHTTTRFTLALLFAIAGMAAFVLTVNFASGSINPPATNGSRRDNSVADGSDPRRAVIVEAPGDSRPAEVPVIPPVAAPEPAPAPPANPAPTVMLILSIQVNPGPLQGQSSRATENISLRPPPGTTRLRWEIEDGGASNIRINLTVDRTFGPDHTVLNDITNGTFSPPISGSDFYISAVQNATRPFTVRIYAE